MLDISNLYYSTMVSVNQRSTTSRLGGTTMADRPPRWQKGRRLHLPRATWGRTQNLATGIFVHRLTVYIVIIYLVGGIPTPLKFMSIQELVTKKTILYEHIFTLVGGIFVLD